MLDNDISKKLILMLLYVYVCTFKVWFLKLLRFGQESHYKYISIRGNHFNTGPTTSRRHCKNQNYVGPTVQCDGGILN